MTQAFDKVYHNDLNYILNKTLLKQYVGLLQSYIKEKTCKVKQDEKYFEMKEIRVGALQGSVLGPIVNLLHTSNLPQLENPTITTFANDTVILIIEKNLEKYHKKVTTKKYN